MSSNPKTLIAHTSHSPFQVRLATKEEMAQNVTVCKKCENLKKKDDSTTIHSTLAYSRCRCHRVFQYRDSQQKLISSASEGLLLGGTKDFHTYAQEALEQQEPSTDQRMIDGAQSGADPSSKLQRDSGAMGKGAKRSSKILPTVSSGAGITAHENANCLASASGTEKMKNIERYVKVWAA